MTTEANAPAPEATTTAPTEGAPAAAPEVSQERPSWLPEKFATPEDFAASYAALEAKQSTAAPAAPAAEPADEGARAALTADLKAANVNISDFYAEYAEHGELSAASYEKLEKAGKSRADIDGFIAGQEALIEKQTGQLYTEVGGEAKFKAIQSWAKANLSKTELEAYNQITERGSFAAIRLAVQGLQSRYVAANGREPTLVGGDGAGRSEGFASKQELTAAMRDPRYRKDPAYRAGVEAKLRSGSPFR